jgi:hypothetical protein
MSHVVICRSQGLVQVRHVVAKLELEVDYDPRSMSAQTADLCRECQFFCVRADNGLPPGRPGFYQVGLINRSPYKIAN